MPPSRSDRWQANFEEILRSPTPITVSRDERQGCCRECGRFFTVKVIFLNIDYHA